MSNYYAFLELYSIFFIILFLDSFISKSFNSTGDWEAANANARISRCVRCHFCNASNRDNVPETESDCAIFLKQSYVFVCICGIYGVSVVHLTHSRSMPRIFLEARCNLNVDEARFAT